MMRIVSLSLLMQLLQLLEVPSKLDGLGRRRRRRGLRLRLRRRGPVLERRRERMAEVRLPDGDEVLLILVVKSADDARILLDALPLPAVVVGVVPSVLLPLLLPLMLLPRPPRPLLLLLLLLAVVFTPPLTPHLPLDELANVRMRHRG
jgi:hypothetical protein